jgi:hypothetical protein
MLTKETVAYGPLLPSGTCIAQRDWRHWRRAARRCRDFLDLLLTFPYTLSSASCNNHGQMVHERVYISEPGGTQDQPGDCGFWVIPPRPRGWRSEQLQIALTREVEYRVGDPTGVSQFPGRRGRENRVELKKKRKERNEPRDQSDLERGASKTGPCDSRETIGVITQGAIARNFRAHCRAVPPLCSRVQSFALHADHQHAIYCNEMPYYFYAWTQEVIDHLGEHGVTPEEFEKSAGTRGPGSDNRPYPKDQNSRTTTGVFR